MAVARFPLLLLPVDADRAVWLVTVAALPTAVSGYVGMALLPKVTGDRHHLGPVPASTRAWARYSLVNWASTLAYQAPTFAVPVIVLVNVDADQNASFYVAWGVAALACYVPMAIGQALLSEGGRDGAHLRSQVRLAIVVAGGPDGGRGGGRHRRAPADRHACTARSTRPRPTCCRCWSPPRSRGPSPPCT